MPPSSSSSSSSSSAAATLSSSYSANKMMRIIPNEVRPSMLMTEEEVLSKVCFFTIVLCLVALTVALVTLVYVRSRESQWIEQIREESLIVSSTSQAARNVFTLETETTADESQSIMTRDGEEVYTSNVLRVHPGASALWRITVNASEPESLDVVTFEDEFIVMRQHTASLYTMYHDDLAVLDGGQIQFIKKHESPGAPGAWQVTLERVTGTDRVHLKVIGAPVTGSRVYWTACIEEIRTQFPTV